MLKEQIYSSCYNSFFYLSLGPSGQRPEKTHEKRTITLCQNVKDQGHEKSFLLSTKLSTVLFLIRYLILP
jgi:hypothetical protein